MRSEIRAVRLHVFGFRIVGGGFDVCEPQHGAVVVFEFHMDFAEEVETAGAPVCAAGGGQVLAVVGVDVVEAVEFGFHFGDFVLELEEEAVVQGGEAAVEGGELRGGGVVVG
jgi:hypothetical protein